MNNIKQLNYNKGDKMKKKIKDKMKNKVKIKWRDTVDNQNINILENVEVEFKVVIGKKIVTLSELSNLKNNDCIELEDSLYNNPLKVYVNDVFYAYGEALVVDGNFGIQITKLAKDLNND